MTVNKLGAPGAGQRHSNDAQSCFKVKIPQKRDGRMNLQSNIQNKRRKNNFLCEERLEINKKQANTHSETA